MKMIRVTQVQLRFLLISICIQLVYAKSANQMNVCESTCKCNSLNTTIKCMNRNLISFPGGIPATAKSLYLGNNDITNIENGALQGLSSLVGLYLEDNRINNIEGAFKGLVNLMILELRNNNITRIDEESFKCLSNLEELYMDRNAITDIGEGTFKCPQNLNVLRLAENKIANIDGRLFQGLSNLTNLDLSSNGIKTIENGSWQHLWNLRKLNLAFNQISTIDEDSFKDLDNLEELDLGGNDIMTIENGSWQHLWNLRQLDLRRNGWKKLENGSWQHLQNLIKLYLSDNEISTLDEDSFKNLDNLEELDLSNNGITNITNDCWKHLQNLKKLNLFDNNILIIEADSFKNLDNLENLNLMNNHIKVLQDGAFSSLSSIIEIDLSGNKDMVCGCDLPYFIELIKEKDNRTVNVIGKCTDYGNSKIKLNHTQKPSQCKVNYGGIQCHTCSGTNCNNTKLSDCQDVQPACMTRITKQGGTYKMEKECSTDEKCSEAESQKNVSDCNNWTVDDSCVTCCTTDLCNTKGLEEWTRTFELYLLYQEKENKNEIFLKDLSIELEKRFSNMPGIYTVENCGAQGKTEVFIIQCRVPKDVTIEQVKKKALVILKSQTLRTLGVGPDSELSDKKFCNEDTTNQNGTFRWPATKIGFTATIPCYAHVATRSCVQRSEIPVTECPNLPNQSVFTGIWEEANMSQCHNTEWITGNVTEMQDHHIDKQWTKTFELYLLYQGKENKNETFMKAISIELEQKFSNMTGSYTVKNCGAQGKTEVFIIQCRVPKDVTIEQVKKKALVILKSQTLRTLGIGPDSELSDKKFCNDDTTNQNGTFHWPATKIGDTATILCYAYVATRSCVQRSEIPVTECPNLPNQSVFTGIWKEANMSQCHNTEWITRNLTEMQNRRIDKHNIKDLFKQLTNICQKFVYFKEIDVVLAVDIYKKITSNMPNNEANEDILLIINNIINTPEKILIGAEKSNRTVSRILDIMEKVSEKLQVEKQQLKVLYPKFGIGITKVDKATFNGLFYGILPATNKTGAKSVIYNSPYPNDKEITNRMDYISIPKTISKRLEKNKQSAVSRISFYSMDNDKLYKVIKKSGDRSNSKPESFINSRIIAANIPERRISNLENPIIISFNLLYKNGSNSRCVFWDDSPGHNPHWSTSGCKTERKEKVFCFCNHLTSFAILTDAYQNVKSYIICYIGCGISFVFLILTIIVHAGFKKLWSIIPSKILVNLCGSLAATHLIVLVGMRPGKSKAICKFVAILLHYFLIASAMWITVEALHICQALIATFRACQKSFVTKSSIFAWGVPGIIIILTLIIKKTNNYIRIDDVCWLSQTSFYIAFLLPVVIIILVCLIVFLLIIGRFLSMKKEKRCEHKTRKFRLFGIVSVLFLFGASWYLAYYTFFGGGDTVFIYICAIFHALQGLFIFIHYCIFDKNARNVICSNSCKKKKYVLNKEPKNNSGETPDNETEGVKYSNSEDKKSEVKL